MKLKLKSANAMQKPSPAKKQEQRETLGNIVKRFIDGPVREAIEKADTQNVNVPIPFEAYEFGDDFYAACQGAIGSLGYTCKKSHDGGGMYDTLAVTW